VPEYASAAGGAAEAGAAAAGVPAPVAAGAPAAWPAGDAVPSADPADSGQAEGAEGADAGFGRLAQGSKLIAAAMKGHQPRRTGPRDNVLMHRRPHGPARAARYHQQAARYNSGVLAAKVSCHAASTAAT
jgi:hypothetical protein